ncbi:MAG: polysaccharide pyruvyl transferase family protein [Methanomassiliicoccus sp.]|nr:polysaccharide pyruvyl transferase family protein [Methanomassiliicoccus sp.]
MDRPRFLELGRTASTYDPAGMVNIYGPVLRDEYIRVDWFTGVRNWGDRTSPIIVQHLSGRRPVLGRRVSNPHDSPVHMVVGSLLQVCRDENTVVWGTGLISANSAVPVRPRAIRAVRGPLTRERLLRQGIDCPPIYGDPVLLFPRIYRPEVTKRYKLGIVPHYFDASSPHLEQFQGSREVKVLDVGSGVGTFVDDLCSCRAIASSSLHGCIAADAYRIPSLWIELSSKVEGRGFKFRDYYESIGESNVQPQPVRGEIDADLLIAACSRRTMEIDLNELLEACPFLPGDDATLP